FAATPGAGVFRSDGGAWSVVSSGLDATRIASLVALPGTPPSLLAAVDGGGIAATIATDDGADAWGPANDGLPTIRISVLARDPTEPGRVYAAGGGVFRSDDGGGAWTTVTASFELGPTALVVDPTDGAT